MINLVRSDQSIDLGAIDSIYLSKVESSFINMITKLLQFACIVATCFVLRILVSAWSRGNTEEDDRPAEYTDGYELFRIRREAFLRHIIYNMAFETWTKVVHKRLHIWNAKVAWWMETFLRIFVQILISLMNDFN